MAHSYTCATGISVSNDARASGVSLLYSSGVLVEMCATASNIVASCFSSSV
jgi:hypothetical protein